MAYSHTTFGTAKTLLAERLSDLNKVFWIDAELGLYIVEALRTWNAASFYDRTRVSFPTIADQAFYSLTSTTDAGAGGGNPPAALAPTLSDRDLVNLVQYHLLEVVNNWGVSTAWGGSDQFTMSDVVGALQRRRDQFLLETGLVLTRSTQAAPVSPTQTVVLSGNIEDVRRLAWKRTSTSAFSPIFRDDLRSANSLVVSWTSTPGTPKVYDVIIEAPTEVRLVPAPDAAGTLDLLTITSGTTLDVTTGVLIGIPDDLTWAVKFGAIADLLGRDGQARDPARAIYCERRYKEGVELAKIFTSVLNYDIDGSLGLLSSVYDFDTLEPSWQTSPTSGAPKRLGVASWNMIALSPVPINTSTTVTLDVLSNMTIPSADGDQLQIGKEHLSIILDYAAHLASFKMAGSEFEATMPHYKRMFEMALLQNDRLRANSKSFDILRERREYRQRPKEEEAA